VYYAGLVRSCAQRASRVAPEQERAALASLIAECGAEAALARDGASGATAQGARRRFSG
jgi:hypothetical protein